MAGDWIKWSKGLTRKMEIMQLSARLHVAPAHAAGTLMVLMEWVDENVSNFDQDGNARVTLGPLQPAALDVTLGISGFLDSLAEVGWVRTEGDVLVFVHAGRHNGQTAKARALTKDRVANHRNAKRNAGSVTGELPEKRREEDNTHTGGSEAGESQQPDSATLRERNRSLPGDLDTKEFREVWSSWIIYWAQNFNRGKAMADATAFEHLRICAALGEARAMAAIKNSITRGLREPAEPFAPKASQKSAPGKARASTVWELRQREEALQKQIQDFLDGHRGQKYIGMEPGRTSPYDWTEEGTAAYRRLKADLAEVKKLLASAPRETDDAA